MPANAICRLCHGFSILMQFCAGQMPSLVWGQAAMYAALMHDDQLPSWQNALAVIGKHSMHTSHDSEMVNVQP